MSPATPQAILIVDHGSRLDAANALLESVAGLLSQRSPGHHVEYAHMELAQPTIAEGIERCVAAGARDITVHPYMLGPGRHATQDIPRLVAAALAAHPGVRGRVSAPLGAHPLLAEVILQRVQEAIESDKTKESKAPS